MMRGLPESPLLRAMTTRSRGDSFFDSPLLRASSLSSLDPGPGDCCFRRHCCFGRCLRHFRFQDLWACFVPGILRDFDLLVLLNVALAELATYLCIRFGLDMAPTVLVGLLVVPTVMPLAFSISQSHSRRERALAAVGSLQSSLWTLHAIHAEWLPSTPPDLPATSTQHQQQQRRRQQQQQQQHPHFRGEELALFRVILGLLRAIRLFATQTRARGRNRALEAVYSCFRSIREANAALSGQVAVAGTASLRAGGFPGAALLSHTSTALNAFEQIRVVRDYPTPRSARQFHKLTVTFLPVLLAPGFARAATETNPGSPTHWSAYYLAAVVSLVFSMLNSVQDALDNPFNCCAALSSGDMRFIRAHPDNLDLSKLEFYPALSMLGNLDLGDGTEVPAEATLRGGPTPVIRPAVTALFRGDSGDSLGLHLDGSDNGGGSVRAGEGPQMVPGASAGGEAKCADTVVTGQPVLQASTLLALLNPSESEWHSRHRRPLLPSMFERDSEDGRSPPRRDS